MNLILKGYITNVVKIIVVMDNLKEMNLML
jgi:hypothetical protein